MAPNLKGLANKGDGDRNQPWKTVWPPAEEVKPASEKSRAGQMRVLYAGGGAYPNFIKPTEGVRL